MQRLASYPDWTLVVVGDEKTSDDWNLPDVHYLSLETQVIAKPSLFNIEINAGSDGIRFGAETSD